MRSDTIKSVLRRSAIAAALALYAGAAALGAQVVNLSAGPATAIMADGKSVPMWGYSCGAAATGSTATCAALDKAATTAAVWSPVIITVPTGQDLQINLTNNLSFTPATCATPPCAANTVPTSIVIVGQLGGGLGSAATYTASPVHAPQGVTWPVAAAPGPGAATFNPPAQGPRVQSFATEVVAGTTTALTWTAPNPGTYLIESGTHPSIQGPMGLYGILVVTQAPTADTTGKETAPGVAYPGVSYDAEVPLLLSEIDPVQNAAVSAAVNTAGFSETAVWSGQPNQCGNPASANYQTCYPPAVNYTPLYYLINGAGFDRTNASASLYSTTPAQIAPATGPGTILVRLVTAGLRMHVPSIVGSTTVAAAAGGTTAGGFSLVAQDGNPLPGLARAQSEVFMAAGKTYDVMINAPAAGAPALGVFDRALALSGDATERDAGMLAYIGVNGAALPAAGAFAGAVARADSYNGMIAGQPLSVSDPSLGLIANDTNVYGVAVSMPPKNGSVALNTNGTFTYTPYGALGAVTVTSAGSGYTAPVVTVSAPAAGGIAATATATLGTGTAAGTIAGITLTGGSGYTAAPTLTITDPTGTGATATVAFTAGTATSDSFTYMANGNPTVTATVNLGAATI
ncbi:MAG: hypothetical protein KGI55_08090, partial [Gammaproteobacteria bacterium]|nr:hypothetical protein [Gammaproteobacteria bacterium]